LLSLLRILPLLADRTRAVAGVLGGWEIRNPKFEI
jgi:hypothetical protein